MAGDWIKMRTSLTRDPRVIEMAGWLLKQREFMGWMASQMPVSAENSANSNVTHHVTRHVMISLCVTALLVTWGTAREQGDRDGDDLMLVHCTLDTISAMSSLPLFGNAMGVVEWAIETIDGSVIFPKFFRDNESPDERHKRQAAERQARKREKDRLKAHDAPPKSVTKSNVTGDVTVTHREEKRREELTTPFSRRAAGESEPVDNSKQTTTSDGQNDHQPLNPQPDGPCLSVSLDWLLGHKVKIDAESPLLVGWAKAGVTPHQFDLAIAKAKEYKLAHIPANYLATILNEILTPPERASPRPHVGNDLASVQAAARAIGMDDGRIGEQLPEYRRRVLEAMDKGRQAA